MEDQNKVLLPKNRPSRYIAIVLYFIALAVDIIRFVLEINKEGFLFFSFTILVFDVIFGVFLLIGLIKRNFKWLNLMLIIFKVFDGTYYILSSMVSLDSGHYNILDQVITDFCIVAGFLSFFSLLLFCMHYYSEEQRFWKALKISIIITGIVLGIAFIMSLINFLQHDE